MTTKAQTPPQTPKRVDLTINLRTVRPVLSTRAWYEARDDFECELAGKGVEVTGSGAPTQPSAFRYFREHDVGISVVDSPRIRYAIKALAFVHGFEVLSILPELAAATKEEP